MEDELVAVDADDQPQRHLEIEYMGRARSGIWGTRVTADGLAEEFVEQEGWQPLVQLAPEDIEALRDVVTGIDFFALPEEVDLERPVRDGTTLVWRIEMDGNHHGLVARHNPASPNPALARLDHELQRVVGEALNREADGETAAD
jgi:hypothetical protein